MKKTLEQIEAERLSRRQALGRIGFLAGASAIAALTSDELLRKVGAEMQKRAGDNKVADQVAKELQAAGMANAVGVPPCDPELGFDICPPTCCESCSDTYNYEMKQCTQAYNACTANPLNTGCGADLAACNLGAGAAFLICKFACPNHCIS
jgi:hypothetical protein